MIKIKGSILGYGGILVVLILTSAAIIWVTATGPASAIVATKEGNVISFRNDIELLTKNLDQGIEFISQKAAYKLGSNGGESEGYQTYWTSLYPKIDVLERNLEDKIKSILPPSDYKKEYKEINWEEGIIDVNNYGIAPCGPTSLSKCFVVNGSRYLTVYDKNIDSRIIINQTINSTISSNYFKLLNAGRAIMEDPQFKPYLSDAETLVNELYFAKGSGDMRFSNLDFIAEVKTSPQELPPELVGYWKFDENSGNIVRDSSAYGNDGILGDGTCSPGSGECPEWVNGKFGRALEFDGIDDIVDVMNSDILNFTILNDYTIEAWVSPLRNSGAGSAIVEKWFGGSAGTYPYPYALRLRLEPGNIYAYIATWDGSIVTQATVNGGFSEETWYHLVGVKKGNQLFFYRNSVLTGPPKILSLTSDISNNDNVYFGRRGDGDIPFNGTIDEVKIYNRALSTEEIKTEYEGEVGGDDIVTVVLVDYCYPPNTYCLAPLAPYDNAITEEFHKKGDINWDGVIDDEDVKSFQDAWDSTSGSSNWNSAADLNGDGTVNVFDKMIMNPNVGTKSPPYIIDPATGNQINYDYNKLIFQYKADQSVSAAPPTFNFDIDIIPDVASINSGNSIETYVKVNRLSSIVSPVTLSYTITPDPGTITVSLDTNNQNPTFTSKMSIATTTMTPAGVYTITVTAMGGALPPRIKTYTLTVNPSMFFALNINPNARTIDIGQTTTTDVSVTLTSGTPSQVILEEINNPSNVTRSFSPNNQPPDYTSTLEMRDVGGVPGTYILKARGRGGGSTMLAPDFILTVAPPFQFVVNLNSYAGTVIPGQSITIPGEVTYIQGISKNVVLTRSVSLVSGSGDPSKISVSFTPSSSGTPTFPFSMTIGTPSDRLNGRFAIVVNGDGGGFHDDATYTLDIQVPTCYVDADCNDGNACTGNTSAGNIDTCTNGGTLSASCYRPALPAGTLPNGNACGTNSANCPDRCSGSTQYRNGVAKTCSKTCDGTGRAPPTGCQSCTPPTSSCTLTSADYGSITSCGTDSANCPDRCSSSYEYRNGVAKTCNRVCADAVSCQASCTPDTSPIACPLATSYGSITSCGGSTATCADICSGGVEYRNGGSVSCTKACADAVSCSGSCSPPACTAANYGSSKICRYGCRTGIDCWGGKLCPSVTCSGTGCLFPGPYGTSCTTTNTCRREDISAPTCTYTSRWITNIFDCIGSCGGGGNWCDVGFWFCCGRNNICTATCSIDTNCKYV